MTEQFDLARSRTDPHLYVLRVLNVEDGEEPEFVTAYRLTELDLHKLNRQILQLVASSPVDEP